MVVVLPWHDPVRVTEQVIALDILSGGRTLLGVGRGIAEVEFSGLGIPMEESRTRFLEIADILFGGLETGWVASDGLHFQQPSRPLRPRPLQSFKGRGYCAAMSPESIGMVAELGLNLMIVAQKPWDATVADVERYRNAYSARHGSPAPPPSAHVVTFCDPDRDRAHELGRQYMRTWYASSIDHYNLAGSQFQGVAGYDHYARMSDHLNRYGEGAKEFLVDLQVCGTPDECVDQIRAIQSTLGSDHYVATLSFGGMSGAESARNVRSFATEVLPALKELDPIPVEA
jgi:alkanesulfonate monooxygenase SsuD/methylene tetrahydromethanopterin reductase-like flavin-dependent oxidoreductase (luciferase family)